MIETFGLGATIVGREFANAERKQRAEHSGEDAQVLNLQ